MKNLIIILILTLAIKCFAQLEEVEVTDTIFDNTENNSLVNDSAINNSLTTDSVTKESKSTDNAISSDSVPETVSGQICSLCECKDIANANETSLTFEILCTSAETSLPDLDKIEWPQINVTQRIRVVFDGLGLTEIQRLPTNHFIEEFSLNNNAIVVIWPKAFIGLPNLKKLSLSQNKLAEVSEDMFLQLNQLEELDLSYNKLTDFNSTDVSPLTNLKSIDLKGNFLTKVPMELSKLKNLENLDLSKNLIFHLEFNEELTKTYLLSTIKYLNLSGNKLSLIFKKTFYKADVLRYLDLSDSEIGHIEQDAFTHCPNLIELNLSHNRLISSFAMPKDLQIIYLSHNSISKWPSFPNSIRNIDISYNQLLGGLFDGYTTFDELQVLNIAGNELTTFQIQTELPRLKFLDISYNLIQHVPSSISSETLPSLLELRLDGNPLQDLRFKSDIALKKVYLNFLNNIVEVEENALAKIRGRELLDDSESNGDRTDSVVVNTECVQVFMSHCEHLSNIDDLAFFGVPLCKLDVSYNNLTSLSKDLTSWEELKFGTDLQGNPWRCDCGLQWVLDELLQVLYVVQPDLLHDLKCETPRGLQGQRLVHWYNWGRSPLCGESNRYRHLGDYVAYESQEPSLSTIFGADKTQVLLIIAVISGLLIIVGLIAYLVLGTKSRNYQIRKAMLTKRQTVTDAMYQNERNRDQVTSLTKV